MSSYPGEGSHRGITADSRRIPIALGLFAVALVIRVWGADWGLPHFFSGDEVTKRDTALHFPEKDFVHHPDHPSFTYNTLFLIYRAMQAVGDHWTLADYHHAGRLWMAVLGALTVVAVWRLGCRLDATGRVGIVAAVLLAVMPLHTACSRYIKEDAPLGLAITLTVLAGLTYLERPTRKGMALAFFLAGVTFSTKYTGGIIAVPLAVAVLVTAVRSRVRLGSVVLDGLVATATFVAGFFVVSPIFLVHPDVFYNGILGQVKYSVSGHAGIIANPWREWWTYYLRDGIIPGMTWPAAILALVGLVRMPRLRHGWFVVLASVCIYLLLEQGKSRPDPFAARWLMMLVPLLAVAAAVPFVELVDRLGARMRPALAAAAVAVVVLVPPLVTSVLIIDEARHDTRLVAGRWMEENVPEGATIVQTEGLQTLPASDFWRTKWVIDDRDVNNGINAEWSGDTPPWFVVTSFKYQRFLDNPGAVPDRDAFYEALFRYPLVKEFRPRWFTYGRHSPVIRVYRPNGGVT